MTPKNSLATVCVLLLGTACGDDESSPSPQPLPNDASVSDSSQLPNSDASGDAQDAADPAIRPTGVIDRAGRPAVAFSLVGESQRDVYNRMDTFGSTAAFLPGFQQLLYRWDMLDGVDSWDGGGPDASSVQVPIDAGADVDAGTTTQTVYTHPLTRVLPVDLLIVDTSKPFSPSGYLEIEHRALVSTPGSHSTCGGRWFNDDAVDKMLSFVIKRELSGVSDGVSAPTKLAQETFPYLAAPN